MTSKIFKNLCCGAAFAVGLASAQSMSKSADVKFADAAAHGGAAEVMMGKLAGR